jgi:alkanesulfonate monooxygenase SsuD/methylene tetrahydromethanopterin reductase-like flavin-dependent oxidoreductase (luciferase family)
MGVTADTISRGRLILGLGAGGYDPEYEAFGYPTDHRVSRFEETLRIIKPLLRGERLTLAGRFHDARDSVLLPAADRPIPILIAAKSPRMLRLAARCGDAWNTAWFGLPDGRLRQRLADLDAALAAKRRDPTSIRRTVGVEVVEGVVASTDDRTDATIGSLVDALVAAVEAYETLAFDDLISGYGRRRSVPSTASRPRFENEGADQQPRQARGPMIELLLRVPLNATVATVGNRGNRISVISRVWQQEGHQGSIR